MTVGTRSGTVRGMDVTRSALADPAICPDCRQPLADSVCTGCGLDLNGPLGPTLWGVMLQADALVGRIRAEATGRGVTAPTPAPAYAPASAGGQQAVHSPAPAGSAVRRPSRRVHVSVQGVLLALGGLLVTVAAVVFLAMSWSALGVGGRTAVLGAVTAALLGVAVVVTRRGLGASAETLWLLVTAMSVLDVLGAAHVGLWGLDRLSWVGLAGVHAGILGTLAVAAVVTARAGGVGVQGPHDDPDAEVTASKDGASSHTPVGVQMAAALGLAVWFVSNLAGQFGPMATWSSPVRSSVVVLVAGALAHGLTRRKVSLPVVGAGAVIGAAVAWCVLVVTGVDRLTGHLGNHWSDLDGWPLLAAALPPALASWVWPFGHDQPSSLHPRRSSSTTGDTAAAAVAVGLLAAFAAGPSTGDEVATAKVSAIVVVLAILAALLFRRGVVAAAWARAAALWTMVGVVVLGWVLISVLGGVQAVVPAYGRGRPGSVLQLAGLEPVWVVAVAMAGLLAVVAVGWSAVPTARRHHVGLAGLCATVAGLGAYVIAALSQAPLWSLCGGAFLAACGFAVASLRDRAPARDRGLLHVAAAMAFGLAVWDAAAAHVLGSLLAAVVALLAGTVLVVGVRRSLRPTVASAALPARVPAPVVEVAAVVFVLAAAVSWHELAAALGLPSFTVAVALAVWAAGAGLAAQLAAHRPIHTVRVWVESAAAVVGIAALALVSDPSQAGVVLTVSGAAVAGIAVIATDRLGCSWISAALLAGATFCRLWAGDRFPEVYALPVAALLVAGGWWQLRRQPAMSSFTALGAGLGLGFGPSLLLALGDPLSGRALAVFATALAVLALGVWSHWAAPLWAGALTAASLALVELFPTIHVLPRWVVLGSVGAMLVGVGVTWEARRRDARRAGQYLDSLR